MVHAVNIEDAELLIRYDDRIGFHIVGQVIIGNAVVHGAVGVFKEDGGAAVHRTQLLPPGGLVEIRFATVDADHVRDLHGVCQEFPHVRHVVVKRRAVGYGDHLGPVPQAGQTERVQLVDPPHGIVFQNDAGRLVLVFQLLQTGRTEFFFLLQHDEDALVFLQGFLVPFFFAVLTAEDQHLAAVGETLVAQHREAKRGFTAFQESGNQVYRYKSANHK